MKCKTKVSWHRGAHVMERKKRLAKFKGANQAMRNHILQSINHLNHKYVKLVEAMKLNSHVSE